MDIDPQSTEGWNYRGIVLTLKRQYGEAVQSYEKSIAINPEDPVPWYGKSYALEGLGRNDEASKALSEARFLEAYQINPFAEAGLGS